MKTIIHWFRRDLRISDNTALSAACSAGGRVIPVYIVSDWKGSHRWTGANRQHFLCGCLESLAANLEAIGGRLIIRRGDAIEELAKLAREAHADAIFFNRDPDPHGRMVEDRLTRAESLSGIEVKGFKDVCLHERDDVLNGSGLPFRVFTPYSKAWAKLPKPAKSSRPGSINTPADIPGLSLPKLSTWGLAHPSPLLPAAGEKAARKRLKAFLETGAARYSANRDEPSATATSRISQDLRFGLLSIREVFSALEERSSVLPADARHSAEKFASELIWREFYMQILWHFPDVLEQEFQPVFRGMTWPGNSRHFDAWREGRTGFPIVDAAMRELNESGFMHNRTRMISAMFLTKDLHIDWRLGEQYFMQKLTDGEIASNNGGWQWSAGTGADAAPYFRIQNPWTQTRRYDPEGAYIKKWVPELRDVPATSFFDPPVPGKSLAKDYPPPIVEHARERDVTLSLFAHAKEAAAAS